MPSGFNGLTDVLRRVTVISGALLNANFITGLNSPGYLYCDGNGHLYVCEGNNTIGEYTTSGAVVNATLITGVLNPEGIIVVPEPSSLVLVLTAAVLSLAKAAHRSVWQRYTPHG